MPLEIIPKLILFSLTFSKRLIHYDSLSVLALKFLPPILDQLSPFTSQHFVQTFYPLVKAIRSLNNNNVNMTLNFVFTYLVCFYF